jgi:hypothetical protein
MFPYERFYGFLKSLVHNRLFSEGSIVRGYKTIEAVEWAMGYMDPQNPIGVLLLWARRYAKSQTYYIKRYMD